MPAAIRPAEDCRTLSALDEQTRDVGHHRRLTAAPDAQIADAHDGPREAAAPRSVLGVPAAAPCRRRAIGRAQYPDQCTRRKGRTTAPLPAGGSTSPMTASD